MQPNQKYVIQKSPPYPWTKFTYSQHPSFQYIHEYISISRSKLSANGSPLLLPIYLPIKLKVIIFQYNRCHFNQINPINLPLSIIYLSFKLIQNYFHAIQTFLMKYMRIKTHHIKNCRFRDIP